MQKLNHPKIDSNSNGLTLDLTKKRQMTPDCWGHFKVFALKETL